ncbi:MAG: DUF1573 domain-containing protein [Thermoguttaceae bacterium]
MLVQRDAETMRIATPAMVVLTFLAMTAVAAPAMLATGLASRTGGYDDYGRSRLVSRDARVPVQPSEPRTRPASPAPASPKAEIAGAAEKMFLGGATKDFGAIPHGTQLLHRFPITNVHAVPVAIVYLQASCDCVTAAAANPILQPGESTTIDVRMDTRHFTGANMQNVRVKVVGPDFDSTCKLVVSAVSGTDTARGPAGTPTLAPTRPSPR